MSYRTPAHRAAAVNEAKNTLLASRRAVLTTHLNADGDGAGSQVALASWLRANGSEAWVINPTPFPDSYRFLVEHDDWVVSAGTSRARDLCDSADLAVVLDTGEVPRIGRVQQLIRELPTLVIDHHPPGDRPIGGTSLRDPGACAAGELVFDVLFAANGPWPRAALEGLYVAILTDTGGFRFDNATPICHRVVAELIERGVQPERMHEIVYGSAPLRRYRLMERALATLDNDPVAGISWITVPEDAYVELEATVEDLEGLVDIPRSIRGTQVGLLFRLTQSGGVKVSFRSNGPVDVNALARSFGGGGHVKAAGALVEATMDAAVEQVISRTRAAIEALADGEGPA